MHNKQYVQLISDCFFLFHARFSFFLQKSVSFLMLQIQYLPFCCHCCCCCCCCNWCTFRFLPFRVSFLFCCFFLLLFHCGYCCCIVRPQNKEQKLFRIVSAFLYKYFFLHIITLSCILFFIAFTVKCEANCKSSINWTEAIVMKKWSSEQSKSDLKRSLNRNSTVTPKRIKNEVTCACMCSLFDFARRMLKFNKQWLLFLLFFLLFLDIQNRNIKQCQSTEKEIQRYDAISYHFYFRTEILTKKTEERFLKWTFRLN